MFELMRCMIITQGLSRIVAPIVEGRDVVGIIECPPRNKIKNKRGMKKFAVSVYKALMKEQNLFGYCKKKKVPYYLMKGGSDAKLEEWVRDKRPDVIIVYSMSQLLKKNIFSIPKYGTINLHPSFLPAYRGPNPWFWTYYNQDSHGGVTLHYIDEGEDTGDIIYQEKYEIPLGMLSTDMQDLAIGVIGNRLISNALDNLYQLPRTKQPEQSTTKRARNLKLTEHDSVIDFKLWGIERIWHLLRGTESWLNAIQKPQGIFDNQRWRIESFKKVEVSDFEPGDIYRKGKKFHLVTKDGLIVMSIAFSKKRLLKRIFNVK